MEDIHPDLVKTASGNKIIGIICVAIASIIVIAAITISIMFAFNWFPYQLTDYVKTSITFLSHTGLIIAFILYAGAWFLMYRSINWFKQSTKIFNTVEPVKMMAAIKLEKSRENKEVIVILTDDNKKVHLYMYFPAWDIEDLTECEVEVFKSDDNDPIVVKTPNGILWPYPPIVKQAAAAESKSQIISGRN